MLTYRPLYNVIEDDQGEGVAELWRNGATLGPLMAAAPEMQAALAGCADALHECAKMLRQLECPGHATIADIHQEAARAALARAKGG
jgi:hypothetical protein